MREWKGRDHVAAGGSTAFVAARVGARSLRKEAAGAAFEQERARCVPAHPCLFASDRGQPPKHAGRPLRPEPSRDEVIRILVVEDEALIALEMTMSLEDAGYRVVDTAVTGELALASMARAAAEGDLPDLVLMDINLRGGMDGIEAASRLQNLYPKVRIVFVTGQADPVTRRRAEALAPAGYLVKPLRPDELEQAIAQIARRSH